MRPIFALLFSMCLATPVFAAESEGCNEYQEAGIFAPKHRLSFRPGCVRLTLADAMAMGPNMTAAVVTWKAYLDRQKISLTEVYRYQFAITSEGTKRYELGITDSTFTDSPYSDIAGTFALKLEPCSFISMSFISPATPEAKLVHVFIAEPDNEYFKRWKAMGSIWSKIFLPKSYEFYHVEGKKEGKIEPARARTDACK